MSLRCDCAQTSARRQPRKRPPPDWDPQLLDGWPLVDDASPLEAAVPPAVVETVDAHRPVAVLDPLDPVRRDR